MTTKTVLFALAIGAVAIGGTWLVQQVRSATTPARQLEAPSAPLAHETGPELGPGHRAATRAGRSEAALPQQANPPPGSPDASIAWSLRLELTGWSEEDTGPVTLQVFRAEDTEPALATTCALAREIPLDVGALFGDAGPRPDRLRVRADHPAYLPLEAGVLVPEELLQPDVTSGQLHGLVALTRAKAAVTGTVEVHSSDPEARARVAILPFKFDYPFAEPTEVVEPDADGRFRLRADAAERHAVVIFDQRSGRSTPLEGFRVSLRPVTESVSLAPGEERDLGTLVVDDGLSIEGRVDRPHGSSARSGHLDVSPRGPRKAGPFGLVWMDGRYENSHRRVPWEDDGRFAVVGLGSLEYLLSAAPPLGAAAPNSLVVRKKGTSVSVFPPASDVHLTCGEGSVRVTFEIRGEGLPLPGASLVYIEPTASIPIRTDDAGRATLDLDPGEGLHVEGRDRRYPSKELILTADELRASELFVIDLEGPPVGTATLVVQVPPGYAELLADVGVHFILHDVEHSPEGLLQSARMYGQVSSGGYGRDLAVIDLISPGPDLTREGTTWELAGIRAGSYLVRLDPSSKELDDPCYLLNEQFEVSLAPGDRVFHTWVPRTGGLVRLVLVGPDVAFWATIVGSDETPLGLTYTQPGPGPAGWGFTSSVKSLGVSRVFPALPPEQYLVCIQRKGRVVDYVPFEVRPGQVNDVEVDLSGL